MGVLKGTDGKDVRRADEIASIRRFLKPSGREFKRKEHIRGMLLVLNKVWWKIPRKWAEYMVDEASDMSSITGGRFEFDKKKERVVFIKRRKR